MSLAVAVQAHVSARHTCSAIHVRSALVSECGTSGLRKRCVCVRIPYLLACAHVWLAYKGRMALIELSHSARYAKMGKNTDLLLCATHHFHAIALPFMNGV